jgi:hypothetical protein
MSKVSRAKNAATRKAREVAPWIILLARIGYVAKGVVYIIIGYLAFDAAFGGGGQTTGSKGALRTIADEPFGQTLLVLAGIGLFGYALWKTIQATLDPDGNGTDGEGLAKRIGYAASAVLHYGLSYYALDIALGLSGGSDGGTQDLTAKFITHPVGKWLVILVGIGVLVYAFKEAKKAITGKFGDHIHFDGLIHKVSTWVRRAGRLGHGARAVVFALTGFFLVRSAWNANPDQETGLDAALGTLAQESGWLLALVAAGVIGYGIWCLVKARYRSFQI